MKVSELLSSPEKWTKDWYFKDGNGNRISSWKDRRITCYCLMGAGFACYPDLSGETYHDTLVEVIRKLFPDRMKNCTQGNKVAYFNDHPDTTFEDVQRVLKEADV